MPHDLNRKKKAEMRLVGASIKIWISPTPPY